MAARTTDPGLRDPSRRARAHYRSMATMSMHQQASPRIAASVPRPRRAGTQRILLRHRGTRRSLALAAPPHARARRNADHADRDALARGQVKKTLAELAPLEELNGYPGPRLMATGERASERRRLVGARAAGAEDQRRAAVQQLSRRRRRLDARTRTRRAHRRGDPAAHARPRPEPQAVLRGPPRCGRRTLDLARAARDVPAPAPRRTTRSSTSPWWSAASRMRCSRRSSTTTCSPWWRSTASALRRSTTCPRCARSWRRMCPPAHRA